MNKLENGIIKLMKILYEISEDEKNDLIESFSTSSENEKEEILKVLYESYNKFEKKTKTLLSKITKINNNIDEYKEHLNADEILELLD